MKPILLITLIAVLIIIILTLSMILLVKETQHINEITKCAYAYNYQQERYLKNMGIFIKGYNLLYGNYNELYGDYLELCIEKNVVGKFTCTGYSLNCSSQGTNSTVAIGLDISPYDFPVVAVDPKVIPLYSIVEINGIGYIAIDTGGKIIGNRIDILFDTKEEAQKFGRQNLMVRILE